MNQNSMNNESDMSFGSMPSAEIRQLDHSAWWAVFMSLVGTMPRKAEASRLSDDPVHVVHGQHFSIRDCAMHAIDAAYDENLQQVARDYEEQANKLIFSFDKRVYIRVSRIFDRQRLKYLVICAACLLFGMGMALIVSLREKTSGGMTVLITISILLAAASAVMAALTTWRKRKILYRNRHKANEDDSDPGQQQ